METGKVEFTPDYKSEKSTAEIAASHVCTRFCDSDIRLREDALAYVENIRAKRESERARLERAIIEASRLLRLAERAATVPNDFDVVEAQRQLRTVTDALLTFESEQEKKS